RTPVHQTADPRALCKPDLFRQRLLRSRDRFTSIFRQERFKTESPRSSAAGGLDQESESAVAAEKSGRREDSTQRCFGSNGSNKETFACGCGSRQTSKGCHARQTYAFRAGELRDGRSTTRFESIADTRPDR